MFVTKHQYICDKVKPADWYICQALISILLFGWWWTDGCCSTVENHFPCYWSFYSLFMNIHAGLWQRGACVCVDLDRGAVGISAGRPDRNVAQQTQTITSTTSSLVQPWTACILITQHTHTLICQWNIVKYERCHVIVLKKHTKLNIYFHRLHL